VHYTSIQGDGFRALKDGEIVTYELIQGEKGHQARNVTRQKDIGKIPAPARVADQAGSAAAST
jgi:hypothetical protein